MRRTCTEEYSEGGAFYGGVLVLVVLRGKVVQGAGLGGGRGFLMYGVDASRRDGVGLAR